MIDISWELMLAVAILFLMMLFFLNSGFFKPMTKHIDERKRSLNENQINANKNIGDASGLEQETETLLQEARKQAHNNIEEVISLQKKENENIAVAEKEKIDEEMNQFFQKLEVEKEELRKTIGENSEIFKSGIKAKLTV